MAHWIIVADASGARVFSIGGRNKPLELVHELRNPDGRLRTQELTSDGPGRVNALGSSGARSALQPRTNAHDDAADVFVRELAAYLQQEMGKYASLSLVAPPHFLGVLRSTLAGEVDQRVRSTLNRDLVQVPASELRAHVETLLVPGIFA